MNQSASPDYVLAIIIGFKRHLANFFFVWRSILNVWRLERG